MAVRAYKNRKGEVVPDRWHIDYYPRGAKGKKVIEVFVGTKDEAYEYEMEVRKAHRGDEDLPTNPKVVDLFTVWLAWLELHRSEKYHHDVLISLKWLLPHFGHLQVSKITKTIINQYKKNRPGLSAKKNKCTRAINKELGYLRSLISWAEEEKYCYALPFKLERLPEQRPIPQIPHPGEFDLFYNSIYINPAYLKPVPEKPRHGFVERRQRGLEDYARKKAVILFMWENGLRWTEATHIRWENIDWWNGNVMLDITKGGRPRQAVLTDNVRMLLEPLKQETGWVFENRKTGKPWRSFKTLFKNACAKAGIKRLHPHLLRHACGTMTLEATKDLRLVQDLLGHRDIGTTQFYTQIATERIRNAVQATDFYRSKLKEAQQAKNKKKSQE